MHLLPLSRLLLPLYLSYYYALLLLALLDTTRAAALPIVSVATTHLDSDGGKRRRPSWLTGAPVVFRGLLPLVAIVVFAGPFCVGVVVDVIV